METPRPRLDGWALVLGASSGFGAATARYLATCGMNIIGVHFDRRNTQPMADAVKSDIEGSGQMAHFFNINAGDADARATVLDAVTPHLNSHDPPIRCLLYTSPSPRDRG